MVSAEQRAVVRRRLLRQARLFEDARAYAAGVVDALQALAEIEEQPAERRRPASTPTSRQ